MNQFELCDASATPVDNVKPVVNTGKHLHWPRPANSDNDRYGMMVIQEPMMCSALCSFRHNLWPAKWYISGHKKSYEATCSSDIHAGLIRWCSVCMATSNKPNYGSLAWFLPELAHQFMLFIRQVIRTGYNAGQPRKKSHGQIWN